MLDQAGVEDNDNDGYEEGSEGNDNGGDDCKQQKEVSDVRQVILLEHLQARPGGYAHYDICLVAARKETHHVCF